LPIASSFRRRCVVAINLYGPTTTDSTRQVDNTSVDKVATTNTHSVSQKPATQEDTTAFTSDSDAVQSLTKAALEVFPSRQVRVEALREAVSSAQYQLDSDKIAASLVDADI